MPESPNELPPLKTAPVKLFERALRLNEDLNKVNKVAGLVGILLMIVLPASLDRLDHPEKLVYQAAFHTIPLTLTVAFLAVALAKDWLNGLQLLIVPAFVITLGAGIADYFGCSDCGGTSLTRSAFEASQREMPEWFVHSAGPLNAIPYLYFCLVAYYKQYHAPTFIASIICGLFAGVAVLWLTRPMTEGGAK